MIWWIIIKTYYYRCAYNCGFMVGLAENVHKHLVNPIERVSCSLPTWTKISHSFKMVAYPYECRLWKRLETKQKNCDHHIEYWIRKFPHFCSSCRKLYRYISFAPSTIVNQTVHTYLFVVRYIIIIFAMHVDMILSIYRFRLQISEVFQFTETWYDYSTRTKISNTLDFSVDCWKISNIAS